MSENTRIALGVEYLGARYSGWQRQTHSLSVQAELESALSKIANHQVTIICAGRTDAGVNAYEQVVHFDTVARRKDDAWVLGVNSQLPDDIRVLWAKTVTPDFHARYSAYARYYRYLIYNRTVRSALNYQQACWYYPLLAEDLMHYAAQHLLGHHDFTSFRAAACQSHSAMRAMYVVDVIRQGDYVIIDVCANAFLYHMVRNIVGALMAIGSGKQSPDWTLQLLAAKNRSQAGLTAPAQGLYLAGVYYPEHFGLPKHSLFNRLPSDIKRYD